MTCDAAVRLRPVPPALIDSTKKGGPASRWKSSTSPRRLPTAVPPCLEVAVRLQVVTPRLAPERVGDLPPLDDDPLDRLAPLAALLHLAGRLGPALRHRHVRPELPPHGCTSSPRW